MNTNVKPENTTYILPLEDAKERSECGGKAATLCALLQAGFSVPPGFVVKTQGVEALAGKLGKGAYNLACKELGAYLSLFTAGTTLAVRSSAVIEDGQTSSFAGIFQTKLNIQPELTAIVDAIISCREAVYNERVRQYMKHRNIPFTEGTLALIIQQMLQPDASGVAFSEGHSSAECSHIVIEAVPGLGENLVSGRLTPTRFLVPRLPQKSQQSFIFTALQQQGADLPELSQAILKELCEKVLSIEQLFGIPQDIEWCSLASSLFILQSRPITTELRLEKVKELEQGFESTTLRGYGAAPGIATGTTFVIADESAIERFPDGAILLATSTDTDYLNAMQRAKAIVTEEGGLLSHAAIVSRELSIPCVVGAAGALIKFPTGAFVTVDGYTGTIKAGEVAKQESQLDLYDLSDLFCFDSLQAIHVYDTRVLLEPSYSGLVLYVPPTITNEQKQKIVSVIQKNVSSNVRFGLSSKYSIYWVWKRRVENNYIFRDLFFQLVRSCTEMSPKNLSSLIDKTYLFTRLLLSEQAALSDDTDLNTALTTYAALDTANGNYMLVNTILPEGYGIRSVYQAASPYFTTCQISFGEFLTLRGQVNDDLSRRIFAVYDLLTKSREISYSTYKMLGATESAFTQRWTAVLDKLAQLLELDAAANDFQLRLLQKVEAAGIWSKVDHVYKQVF